MYGLGLTALQPTVDRERRDVDRRAEALAEHDLEGVAGVDVLADALDAGLVLLARHRRGDRPRAWAAAAAPAAVRAGARLDLVRVGQAVGARRQRRAAASP